MQGASLKEISPGESKRKIAVRLPRICKNQNTGVVYELAFLAVDHESFQHSISTEGLNASECNVFFCFKEGYQSGSFLPDENAMHHMDLFMYKAIVLRNARLNYLKKIKELNSYVTLRKIYQSTLGNNKWVELFDMGAGSSEPTTKDNIQMASGELVTETFWVVISLM